MKIIAFSCKLWANALKGWKEISSKAHAFRCVTARAAGSAASCGNISALAIPILCWLAMAGLALSIEPEVFTADFAREESGQTNPSWVASYEVRGGQITNGAWCVAINEPVGCGQLDIILNPSAELPALAVTLAFKDVPGTDLSLNLHNDVGELVGVDLFGNLAESARLGHTDTFIVPLSRFPRATRISIRRIRGPLELKGIVAFPVVESLDDLTTEEKRAFAKAIGEKRAPERGLGPLRIAAGLSRPEPTTNVLGEASYPVRHWSGSLSAELAFPAMCSGTCYRFFTNLYFKLFPDAKEAGNVSFVSSDISLKSVLSGGTQVALGSLAPTTEELEKFEQKTGLSLLVAPVALDAVEVLVHPSNQMRTVSFDTLRLIFAEDSKGTGYWDPESGLQGPILVSGGSPNWGTSRFFAERALGGSGFRKGMHTLDVAYEDGIEAFVACNQNAIGFAQHRLPRTKPVKVLPIGSDSAAVAVDARTVNDGSYPLTRYLYLIVAKDRSSELPDNVRRFADLLLSLDGQCAVADAGSFPLSAETLRAARQKLGLP